MSLLRIFAVQLRACACTAGFFCKNDFTGTSGLSRDLWVFGLGCGLPLKWLIQGVAGTAVFWLRGSYPRRISQTPTTMQTIPRTLPVVMDDSRNPSQPWWSRNSALLICPARTRAMNIRAPIRGAAKAAVNTKKAPISPPTRCHHCSCLIAPRGMLCRCSRSTTSRPREPIRKDMVAAVRVLDSSRASRPLIPACTGMKAPARKAMVKNSQTVSMFIGSDQLYWEGHGSAAIEACIFANGPALLLRNFCTAWGLPWRVAQGCKQFMVCWLLGDSDDCACNPSCHRDRAATGKGSVWVMRFVMFGSSVAGSFSICAGLPCESLYPAFVGGCCCLLLAIVHWHAKPVCQFVHPIYPAEG